MPVVVSKHLQAIGDRALISPQSAPSEAELWRAGIKSQSSEDDHRVLSARQVDLAIYTVSCSNRNQRRNPNQCRNPNPNNRKDLQA